METRERLLEAAIQMLHERGYARTTTRQIVEAADAHLPAVNYFFGSKDNLMNEAVEQGLRRWAASTMVAVEAVDAAHPRERLRVSIERFFSTMTDDRRFAVAAIEAFAQAERNDELRSRLAEAYREFRVLVARAATGATAAQPPAEFHDLASVLIALFDGLALQWILSPDDVPDVDSILNSLDTLNELIGNDDKKLARTTPRT